MLDFQFEIFANVYNKFEREPFTIIFNVFDNIVGWTAVASNIPKPMSSNA